MASAEKPQLTLDDILAEIREGNTTTNQKLSKLEEKIDNNQKLIQDYIKSKDAEVKKVRNKVDKIENKQKTTDDTVKKVVGLESRLTVVTDELDQLQKLMRDQSQLLERLQKKEKGKEVDKKRSNVIIEGLKEDDKENIRQKVTKLLTDMGVTNVKENVVTAFRLGNVNKGHARQRPRPILVKLSKKGFKYDIYKSRTSRKWTKAKKSSLRMTYLSKYPSSARNLDVLQH